MNKKITKRSEQKNIDLEHGTRYIVLFGPENMIPFPIKLEILLVKKWYYLHMYARIMQECKTNYARIKTDLYGSLTV